MYVDSMSSSKTWGWQDGMTGIHYQIHNTTIQNLWILSSQSYVVSNVNKMNGRDLIIMERVDKKQSIFVKPDNKLIVLLTNSAIVLYYKLNLCLIC